MKTIAQWLSGLKAGDRVDVCAGRTARRGDRASGAAIGHPSQGASRPTLAPPKQGRKT